MRAPIVDGNPEPIPEVVGGAIPIEGSGRVSMGEGLMAVTFDGGNFAESTDFAQLARAVCTGLGEKSG